MNAPSIKIRTPEEMGKPLSATVDQRTVTTRLLARPYGRINTRMRRGRLLRIKRKPRPHGVYGRSYRGNSGFAEMGHATHFYHYTKGWRKRHTPSAASVLGATLGHWMLLRLDLIVATLKGDKDSIAKTKAAFRRSIDAQLG